MDSDQTQAQPQLQNIPNDLIKRAESLGVLYLAKAPKSIDRSYTSIISEDIAEKHGMIVFEKIDNLVKVAMTDPENIEALNILRFLAEKDKYEFEIYLVLPQIFQEIMELYGSAERAVQDAIKSLKDDDVIELETKKEEDHEEDDTAETVQDAPVAKLVRVVIKHAVEGKASDIHIEPFEHEYRVRFRVDGILHSSLSFPKEVGRAVVSRIKILSNLKIDEKRKPQDGRFRVKEGSRVVDFRVSTFPVVDGEKVVLRLLDKGDKMLSLDSLGIMGKSRQVLEDHIRDSYGIILVTGPTGSGKSTTLYTLLQIINKEERNIVTLEDPIEYSIEGINQSQIRPEINYTFASGLRSILRQDPNVIMVGEIRDSETAELAIHAALTGHLVFSTLHTNSSVGAVPRLIDMGIESFLLASSVRVLCAQRLVRKICEHCKEELQLSPAIMEKIKQILEGVSPEEKKLYSFDESKGLKFYHGKGCEHCEGSGYKGRLAIFEAFEITGTVQEIISEKEGNEAALKKEAVDQGMVSIKQDGILKVLLGLTTLSEVERVTEGSLSVGGAVEDDKG